MGHASGTSAVSPEQETSEIHAQSERGAVVVATPQRQLDAALRRQLDPGDTELLEIGQHVAASLALFASVALLFWYILRLFMSSRD